MERLHTPRASHCQLRAIKCSAVSPTGASTAGALGRPRGRHRGTRTHLGGFIVLIDIILVSAATCVTLYRVPPIIAVCRGIRIRAVSSRPGGTTASAGFRQAGHQRETTQYYENEQRYLFHDKLSFLRFKTIQARRAECNPSGAPCHPFSVND